MPAVGREQPVRRFVIAKAHSSPELARRSLPSGPEAISQRKETAGFGGLLSARRKIRSPSRPHIADTL